MQRHAVEIISDRQFDHSNICGLAILFQIEHNNRNSAAAIVLQFIELKSLTPVTTIQTFVDQAASFNFIVGVGANINDFTGEVGVGILTNFQLGGRKRDFGGFGRSCYRNGCQQGNCQSKAKQHSGEFCNFFH